MPKTSTLIVGDWLFGAYGKRRLLDVLLRGDEPRRGWRQAELAELARLSAKGSVDVHLAALAQLGVVKRSGAFYSVAPDCPLVRPLRTLLTELAALPADPVRKPPA